MARHRLPGGESRAVVLPSAVERGIRFACARAYPEEGCGLLLSEPNAPGNGSETSEAPAIGAAVPMPNSSAGDRRWSYRIAPELLRGVEPYGGDGRRVLGCFHSHPDGPAAPSEPDRARAWPGLIYLIVGVPITGFGPMRAFGLGEGGDPLPELVLRQESLPEDLRSGESPGKGP